MLEIIVVLNASLCVGDGMLRLDLLLWSSITNALYVIHFTYEVIF